MISIVLPVGPERHHRAYLGECLESIWAQTRLPDELVIVDDGSRDAAWEQLRSILAASHVPDGVVLSTWSAPWTLGPAAAYNCGIGLARNDLSFMMGGDDLLAPDCIAECAASWEEHHDPRGFYYVGVHYMDDRPDPDQDLPCNAAMVHRELWRHLGGFPPESAVGAMDAAVISIMMGNSPLAGTLYKVADGRALYQVRIHENQHTATRAAWTGIILEVRNLLTLEWKART